VPVLEPPPMLLRHPAHPASVGEQWQWCNISAVACRGHRSWRRSAGRDWRHNSRGQVFMLWWLGQVQPASNPTRLLSSLPQQAVHELVLWQQLGAHCTGHCLCLLPLRAPLCQ
jgi:hypothetical protein